MNVIRVDEVVQGVPYVMNDEYLNYVIDKYKIDYVVHGDDPCIVDGKVSACLLMLTSKLLFKSIININNNTN